MGDNVLAVMKELTSSSLLDDNSHLLEKKVIYFDILGNYKKVIEIF